MQPGLRIGEVAERAGVSIDTIRYYERQRLLPRAPRTHGGFRIFAADAVERIQFIKQAQSLGLSLDEIKGLLPGQGAGLAECQRVRDLLSTKLADLDEKIARMRDFRKTLAAYKIECEEALAGNRGDCCPVLSEITRTGQATPNKGSKRGDEQ